MPRSRTEAMLAGCCVLSSRYHGAEDYIEQGVDGFIMPDNPLSYAETINQLINYNYKEAVKIGMEAREKATKLFDMDRYLEQWYELLHMIIEGKRPIWKGDKIW